jgi:hypothetical protein
VTVSELVGVRAAADTLAVTGRKPFFVEVSDAVRGAVSWN